jgi:hypothetical protein
MEIKKSHLIKMTKKELQDAVVTLLSEVKELRGIIKNNKGENERPYLAVSVLRVNGLDCAVKIPYNINDVGELIKCTQGSHMADFQAKKILTEEIIFNLKEYEGELL